MARIEKTVFISYRRKDKYAALAVYQYLTNNGYDVFLDYESIPSGDFEQHIISDIKARAHFIVILTPTTLDRCSEPGDWLRREIETALDEKRNVIPLFFDGFSFNSPSVAPRLTGKLRLLKKYNGLEIPSGYFLEAMEKLQERYLNVALDAVVFPLSADVQKIINEKQVVAQKALVVEKNEIKEIMRPAKKVDPTIVAALIGAVATIAVALITVFWNSRSTTNNPTFTPQPTVMYVNTATSTVIPTDTVPPGEPTSTPAPPTDTPMPTYTYTAVPPVAIGDDWLQGCVSSLWVAYPLNDAFTDQGNGCLNEPIYAFAADKGSLSFLQEKSGLNPVAYYGLFAPLPEKGTVTFKVYLKDLENADLWMGIFSQPDIKSDGVLLTIPSGDVKQRVIVQKEVSTYQTIFSTSEFIKQGNGFSFTFSFDTLSATGKVNPFVLTTNPMPIRVTPKWLYLGYKSLGGYYRIEGKFFDFVVTSD